MVRSSLATQPTSKRCVRSKTSGAVFARKEIIDIDESGRVLPLVFVVLVAVFWDSDELLGIDGSDMTIRHSFHFRLEDLIVIHGIEQDGFWFHELVLFPALGKDLQPECVAELGIEITNKNISADL